jgi:hypothetical protein
VQVIDARDLASWIVDAAEQGLTGTYDTISPWFSFGALLETCRRVAESQAEFAWVDGEFLIEHGVDPWMELPLWVGPEDDGFMRTPTNLALANGLAIRPLEATVRDTLGWVRAGLAPAAPPAGLAREKEHRVLDAWFARRLVNLDVPVPDHPAVDVAAGGLNLERVFARSRLAEVVYSVSWSACR